MIEHKSLFYNLNYPVSGKGERLDARMNKELAEGWVPYATIPAGGDSLTGYILMTRGIPGDMSDLVEGLFGRRQA